QNPSFLTLPNAAHLPQPTPPKPVTSPGTQPRPALHHGSSGPEEAAFLAAALLAAALALLGLLGIGVAAAVTEPEPAGGLPSAARVPSDGPALGGALADGAQPISAGAGNGAQPDGAGGAVDPGKLPDVSAPAAVPGSPLQGLGDSAPPSVPKDPVAAPAGDGSGL